jgi:predicted MFS family arabinose efflux permease
VAVVGVVGVASRIGWGRVSERSIGSDRALFMIAALSVLLGLSLTLAESLGSWMLWPIAALAGVSAAAWNSVGMLAVIERVPADAAGGASGVVMAGFLGGLGVGAPAFGRSVDQLGGYRIGWMVVTAVFLAAAMLWSRPAHPDA